MMNTRETMDTGLRIREAGLLDYLCREEPDRYWRADYEVKGGAVYTNLFAFHKNGCMSVFSDRKRLVDGGWAAERQLFYAIEGEVLRVEGTAYLIRKTETGFRLNGYGDYSGEYRWVRYTK